jgi:hypothetical protein
VVSMKATTDKEAADAVVE